MSRFKFKHPPTNIVYVPVDFVFAIVFVCQFLIHIIGLCMDPFFVLLLLFSFKIIFLIVCQLVYVLHVVFTSECLFLIISLFFKLFNLFHKLLLHLMSFLNISPRKFISLILGVLQVLSFCLYSLLFPFILIFPRLLVFEIGRLLTSIVYFVNGFH